MFLSNRRKYFLLLGIFSAFVLSCNWSRGTEDRRVVIDADQKTGFPFSVTEPTVYQGDFVVSSGGTEKKWSVARKNDKWRIDYFTASGLTRTELKSDNFYVIDQIKKTYTVTPPASDPLSTDLAVDELTSGFFRGTEHRDFDDLGRDGNLHKYRIREPANSTTETLILIDETVGLMVRQEFTSKNVGPDGSKYVYEVRNLKTDVDDSIFQLPQGLRKVSPDDLRSKPDAQH